MSLSKIVGPIVLGVVLLGGAGLATPQAQQEGRLSKKELKAILSTAASSVDHEKLARHFEAKAAELKQDAAEHEELAAEYRTTVPSNKGVPPVQWGQHCKSLATSLGKAATEAQKLADTHKQLAKAAAKTQ